jgi:hypothetical protein
MKAPWQATLCSATRRMARDSTSAQVHRDSLLGTCGSISAGYSSRRASQLSVQMQRPRAPGLGRPRWRPGATAPSRSAAERKICTPRPGTASVTTLAPPNQGKSGCPACRRLPGKEDGDNLAPICLREAVRGGSWTVGKGEKVILGSLVGIGMEVFVAVVFGDGHDYVRGDLSSW